MTSSYRPHYHFSPPQNWLNDPNGLVYFNGEYHLFYQYHPDSDLWGPMHWGHAITRDLVNWQYLPIALYPDENGMIFSGSAVVDQNNTSGFGKDALVAAFTHHKDDIQSQSVAYSNDAGRTWTKYSANPVLLAPNNISDFRDPKVFWYGTPENGHWVMCLAVHDRIQFYTSTDLIHWTMSGNFGPGYGSTAGVWETPELFELRVSDSNETRWVLAVGVQAGAPADGSGTQYFVGSFDGKTFISENPPETILWADYGADFYAAQSWNNEPNGRHLLIAWMNNWGYAKLIPSNGTRGIFSLIREVSLKKTESGICLLHHPIPELQQLRGEHFNWEGEHVQPNANLLKDIHAHSLEIIAEFKIKPEVDYFGFRVHVGTDEYTSITYSVKEQQLLVDRKHSGIVDFNDSFANVHSAPLSPIDDTVRLHIFVDCLSIEVFANDGLIIFTESVFPSEASQGLELFSEGGKVLLKSLDIFHLKPATFSSGGN
jgi:fructan beta-fructosidase